MMHPVSRHTRGPTSPTCCSTQMFNWRFPNLGRYLGLEVTDWGRSYDAGLGQAFPSDIYLLFNDPISPYCVAWNVMWLAKNDLELNLGGLNMA
jgi:hypothetical protein